MKNELPELFKKASSFFIKKYKEGGGNQSKLAKELGITRSYLSSVTNGTRSASLELYSHIAEKLYGPLDKFLTVGRRIMSGQEPLEEQEVTLEDPVEHLIARLTYYVVDHQRIEKELADLKQFYETIVEKQQTGILVMDRKHNVIFANEGMNTIAHIPAEVIAGTTPYNANEEIPGLDISKFKEKYNEAFEGLETVSFKNIRIELPDGSTVFVSGSFYPKQENGIFDGMICTIYETTKSHILKNLLLQTLNFSSHGIGVIQQTRPGLMPHVYFLNKPFKNIFGIEDLNTSKIPFVEAHKVIAAKMKNGKEWLDFIGNSISTNKFDQQFIITLKKNNKKCEWISNPLIDDDGNQWGRISTVKEIPQKTSKKK